MTKNGRYRLVTALLLLMLILGSAGCSPSVPSEVEEDIKRGYEARHQPFPAATVEITYKGNAKLTNAQKGWWDAAICYEATSDIDGAPTDYGYVVKDGDIWDARSTYKTDDMCASNW